MINKDIEFEIDIIQNQLNNNKIENFVQKMKEKNQSINYYSKYRNGNNKRIESNIFLGKKAEFLCSQFLFEKMGYPKLEPSLEIYNSKDKNWQCDLPYNKFDTSLPNVTVKSCNDYTYSFCNDYSWSFQYKNNNNQFGTDDLLIKKQLDNTIVALIYMQNETLNHCTIKFMGQYKLLQPFLKDPWSNKLIGIKKCVYYQDLLKHKVVLY